MATITLAPLDLAFVLSEAEGQRSREAGTVAQGTKLLPPGTLVDGQFNRVAPQLHAPVTTALAETSITGILGYWCDPTGGNVDATFLVRDCEVNEAHLIFGALDRNKVMDQLKSLGIIVRTGVLAAPGHTFGVSPATDPALTDTVYGPSGIDALAPGGIYGMAAGTGLQRIEQAEVLDQPDGRSVPLGATVEVNERRRDGREVPPEGEVREVSDDFGVLPGSTVPPTGQPPDTNRPVPYDAPSQTAQQTDRPVPPTP